MTDPEYSIEHWEACGKCGGDGQGIKEGDLCPRCEGFGEQPRESIDWREVAADLLYHRIKEER